MPGSFDPPTLGHVDIVERASKIFDKIIIAVAINTFKAPIFSISERVELLKEILSDYPQVAVESFEGLLLDYVKLKSPIISDVVILRGIRSNTDFEYELQIAHANKVLDARIETVFMVTNQKYSFIRSSIIKELVMLGGTVEKMVPKAVEKALHKKLMTQRKG